MREPETTRPDIDQGAAWGLGWGLGWELFDLPGGTAFGHDGNTIGQGAFLRVVPEREMAVAIFTNGGPSRRVYAEVMGRVLDELRGVGLPQPTPGGGCSPARGSPLYPIRQRLRIGHLPRLPTTCRSCSAARTTSLRQRTPRPRSVCCQSQRPPHRDWT
ncbi:serine hydrolase [Streptomyces sp. NPDC059256]|uniref:serine hydrolase n=1 Tax=Streptomyces sp. NPDC059256 TaxID=3346794 RepID=UPI003688F3A7